MSQTATPARRASFEEPILLKYSPHHELPVSTVSSVGLHALLIGLLLIGGFILATMNSRSAGGMIPTDTVAMEPAGGGGGNPQGVGPGPGEEVIPAPEPPEPGLPDPSDPHPIDPGQRAKLEVAKNEVLQLQPFQEPDDRRLIEEGHEAVQRWLRLDKDVREKLHRALANKGKDGPGGRGGDRPGQGPGSGSKTGPGTGDGDRSRRPLRWVLVFNTRDGRDYKRQLQAFGAIVAIPDPNSPDGYLVIRDLDQQRPEARPEDIGKIDRIYWIDDTTASVQSLSGALGLAKPPPHFIVFFSKEFEEKLLKLELSYRGKKERDITETRFDVRKRGDTYEPIVVSQRIERQ
jgi:hypothetical protein